MTKTARRKHSFSASELLFLRENCWKIHVKTEQNQIQYLDYKYWEIPVAYFWLGELLQIHREAHK